MEKSTGRLGQTLKSAAVNRFPIRFGRDARCRQIIARHECIRTGTEKKRVLFPLGKHSRSAAANPNRCCVAIVSGDGENLASESGASPMETKKCTQDTRTKLTLQSSWIAPIRSLRPRLHSRLVKLTPHSFFTSG